MSGRTLGAMGILWRHPWPVRAFEADLLDEVCGTEKRKKATVVNVVLPKHDITSSGIVESCPYSDAQASAVFDPGGDGGQCRGLAVFYSGLGAGAGWDSGTKQPHCDGRHCYSKPDVSSPTLIKDYKRVIAEYKKRTQRPMNHVRDFFDCIRSRRSPVANPDAMFRSMIICLAADICGKLRRNLKFDLLQSEFVGDAEASRLRSRAMRAPYTF